MISESANLSRKTVSTSLPFAAAQCLTALSLGNESKAEALQFLGARPLHTVVMSSLINDHGLESELNRGTFYGHRNSAGALEGVALIGHTTFVETRTDAAMRAFARVAQDFRRAHVIVGEQASIDRFWNFYAVAGQPLRRLCRETLWELNEPPVVGNNAGDLRIANVADLSLIVPAHAAMAREESGVDPLQVDREGFCWRCRRRIEQGRVWVCVEEEKLIFKADIIGDAAGVIYLEGICVREADRGKGLGSLYLGQLSQRLLARSKSISVLVNCQTPRAGKFFQRLGFVPRSLYDTIYLQMETVAP
jgi:predicted GNAT family acetyltransferase